MKVCISEFPDDPSRQAAAWEALARHAAATQPELVVLPEMPFCEWIFVGDAVEPTQWSEAVDRHDHMIERLGELGAPWVVSSRPIDHLGRRFNEAFLWSVSTGYQALRRKWYAPRAKETVWFDQGDRNFRAVSCGPLRFGVQMCSEMMFPEHLRALGLAGAHLVTLLRAGLVLRQHLAVVARSRGGPRPPPSSRSSRPTSTLPWPRSRSPRTRATYRECTSDPPDPDPVDISRTASAISSSPKRKQPNA